ncbi:MAG: hypothetical protein SXV54_24285 [Chloroflexota bacterium]|nr:hypothetical protein [Chloroflexota bacterium]
MGHGDNPQYDAKFDVAQAVLQTFTATDPFRFINTLQIQAGKHIRKQAYARLPSIPRPMREAFFDRLEQVRLEYGEYPLPKIRVDVPFSNDQWSQAQGAGQMSAIVNAVSTAMVKAKTKLMFQNSNLTTTTSTLVYPYYGLADAGTGNGTASRPLTAGSVTAAGAWTTATYGATDLGTLRGLLEQFQEFTGPYLGFYPRQAAVPRNYIVPDQSGQVVYFHELMSRVATWEKIGDDENGANLATGSAETSTDFELIMIDPAWFVELYDTPPLVRHWQNDAADMHYVQFELHSGIMPIPVYMADGKIYKAMAYADALGS